MRHHKKGNERGQAANPYQIHRKVQVGRRILSGLEKNFWFFIQKKINLAL